MNHFTKDMRYCIGLVKDLIWYMKVYNIYKSKIVEDIKGNKAALKEIKLSDD